MISYIENFLDEEECSFFITLFKHGKIDEWVDNVYSFSSINLLNLDLHFSKFSSCDFQRFRVQRVNENTKVVNSLHRHYVNCSFIIFLNDEFKGGELVFEDRTFSPKTGDMVYFSGKAAHKVNKTIGDRYTLVGFVNNNPDFVKKNKFI